MDENMAEFFDWIDMKDGDESATIQPWEGSLWRPTDVPKPLNKMPKISYEIEFVYGAKMSESRNFVHINSK